MRKTPLTAVLAFTGFFTVAGTAAYFLHDTNTQSWQPAANAPEPSPFQPQGQAMNATAKPPAKSKPALPDRIESATFAQVANAYQNTARYRDYSAPMNQAQLDGYLGNNHNPVTLEIGDTKLSGTAETSGESVTFSEIEPGSYQDSLSTVGMKTGESELRVTVPLDGSCITHVARFHVEPPISRRTKHGHCPSPPTVFLACRLLVADFPISA